MSNAVIPTGRPFTVADLEAMPDDGNRYELIDALPRDRRPRPAPRRPTPLIRRNATELRAAAQRIDVRGVDRAEMPGELTRLMVAGRAGWSVWTRGWSR